MDCPLQRGRANIRATEIFIGYSAGTLPASEMSALEQHLEQCPACRTMAASQSRVWAALDAWKPAPVDSAFDAKLYSRIASEIEKPRWERFCAAGWSWKPAMPVAAACAALLAAFLITTPVSQTPQHPSVQPRVDIEQLERALDDIDMLKQIGIAAAPHNAARPENL